MDKQKIIYESINEAKDSMSLSLKMSGSFLDYVAYDFPDSIKLTVVDNLYNLTNKAMDIINFSNKFSVFKEKENIHFAFWTSSYGSIAEVDNNGGCSFNPVLFSNLSDNEMAFVIFHEKGHRLGHHKEIFDELERIQKIIDIKVGSTNTSFNVVLSRYFEAEADKFALALLKNSNYNNFSYHTALLKYKFSFEHDIDDFSLGKYHPSSHERIERLDKVKNLDIENMRRKSQDLLLETASAVSLEDALAIEKKWYEILAKDFSLTRDSIVSRIRSAEKSSDKRLYQYSRALKRAYDISIDNDSIKHRDVLLKDLSTTKEIIDNVKVDTNKNLSSIKKGKIISKSLSIKGKEILKEWMR